MKLNLKEVYEERVKQIDIDIKRCIRKKDWNGVKALKNERLKVMAQINMMG